MKIVFMGTPIFAVPSLISLNGSGHKIPAVVTQPDRPSGRGLHPKPSPVKCAAQAMSLPVIQPDDLKAPSFRKTLSVLKADLFIVVGFRILPPEIFTLPEKGTINLHASLLPKYRGAAPIQWAIIKGETTTGLTTFFIQEKVDTGDMILQRKISIGKSENYGELSSRMAMLGADLILETVAGVAENTLSARVQEGTPTKAPKIRSEHCRIQWENHAGHIINQVRGLSPLPGAFTRFRGKTLKIFKAEYEAGYDSSVEPGMVIAVQKNGFVVATSQGSVLIVDVQLEGKKRMEAGQFLRGSRMVPGEKLDT
jgi:methionyl-tRNA formyltransferase